MNTRAIAISILALVGLVAAACGADTPTPTPRPANTPTPTPSEPLAARCFATEAFAAEDLVAVIGEDLFPTSFDAINSGGCDFTGEVSNVEIMLEFEFQHDPRHALRGSRSRVADPFDRRKSLLEYVDDLVFHRRGRRPFEGDHDADEGKGHIRILIDPETEEAHHPEHSQRQGHHPGEDRAVDREI